MPISQSKVKEPLLLRNEMKEIIQLINPNWYSVALIELLVFGTLMLFIKELPFAWNEYLVPALMVHVIGTGLIGYFQGALFRAKGIKNEYKDPVFVFGGIYVLWFIALIFYFAYRNLI